MPMPVTYLVTELSSASGGHWRHAGTSADLRACRSLRDRAPPQADADRQSLIAPARWGSGRYTERSLAWVTFAVVVFEVPALRRPALGGGLRWHLRGADGNALEAAQHEQRARGRRDGGTAGRPAQAPGTAGSAPLWQCGPPAGPARSRGSDACRARRTGAGRDPAGQIRNSSGC
jgi:hypothetical protein